MKKLEIKNIDCHAALAITKNAQSGRSMIEMLGVLAIIGVLSVGGIAGYSKAMMKYKINKTIEQITLIVGNFRTFYSRQKEIEWAGGWANGYAQIVQKAKLIPDEMMVLTDGVLTNVVNAFGGQMGVEYDAPDFYLTFSDVPPEACIELLSHDWTTADVHKVGVSGSDAGSGLWTPADIDQVVAKCSVDYIYVEFYFKVK
ncbi:MAG: hypothetical protein IJ525_07365 [Alphaproteobacteria bacterium]|nr:hypothetical protein [Alphaproteobacteria bacterium]